MAKWSAMSASSTSQRDMEPSIARRARNGLDLRHHAHGQGFAYEAAVAALDWLDADARAARRAGDHRPGECAVDAPRRASSASSAQADATYKASRSRFFRRPAKG